MSHGVYVAAGRQPWNKRIFKKHQPALPGTWHYIATREEMTVDRLQQIKPDIIFFLHWSWKVPDEIVGSFECIGFHMTDLPFGRGGSPLQNLIQNGVTSTRLSAFRLTSAMDEGDIYLKADLDLTGTAQEILERATDQGCRMMKRIIEERPTPQPQVGEAVYFRRRSPDQSEIPPGLDAQGLYDFVRMLDAEGYPRAFVRVPGFRVEFSRAAIDGDSVTAQARFHLDPEVQP